LTGVDSSSEAKLLGKFRVRGVSRSRVRGLAPHRSETLSRAGRDTLLHWAIKSE
jgi:hypothetical protein